MYIYINGEHSELRIPEKRPQFLRCGNEHRPNDLRRGSKQIRHFQFQIISEFK
jgi:hypothetical protein